MLPQNDPDDIILEIAEVECEDKTELRAEIIKFEKWKYIKRVHLE